MTVQWLLYGSGSGIRSIARGTVPLALFGREGYAILMGRIAMPTLIAGGIACNRGLAAERVRAEGDSDCPARRGDGQHLAGRGVVPARAQANPK